MFACFARPPSKAELIFVKGRNGKLISLLVKFINSEKAKFNFYSTSTPTMWFDLRCPLVLEQIYRNNLYTSIQAKSWRSQYDLIHNEISDKDLETKNKHLLPKAGLWQVGRSRTQPLSVFHCKTRAPKSTCGAGSTWWKWLLFYFFAGFFFFFFVSKNTRPDTK